MIWYEYRLFGIFKLWTIGPWRNKKEARSRIRILMRPFIMLVPVRELKNRKSME
jgi:hypothetical protein